MPPKQRKIAVMGSRSVGKSSLAIQFAQGQFVDSYDPTIENTFNKNMKIQGQEYEVLVVDTAGQDEYSIFPTQYTVDIDGYVLVYSIDSEKSFEVVQAIYEKLVDLLGNPSFPLIIVGNKSDLHMNRVVPEATGRKLAADLKAKFFETSAKDNNCATDLFTNTIIQIEKSMSGDPLPVLSLPDHILDQTLRFLSYHDIAMLRRVSKKFDETCQRLLNQGFRAAEKFHAKCLKDVKAKLPRRESERRNHRLSRHCDILTAIETRISLLSMTFLKYVDVNMCCFIPGKVIDEIFSVLRIIVKDENPPRAFEILQELRDISSMAMEYFDDKIVPHFKYESPLKYSPSFNGVNLSSNYPVVVPVLRGQNLSFRYDSESVSSSSFSTPSSSRSLVDYPLPMSEPSRASRKLFLDKERMAKTVKKVKKACIVSRLKKQAEMYKSTVETQNCKIVDMDKKIDQQNEVIQQQNAKIAEQAEQIAAIHRRFVESGLFSKLVTDSETASESRANRKRSSERDEEEGEKKKLKVNL